MLPGHTPMLASLAVGEMWYRKGQEKVYVIVAGFAEVLPGSRHDPRAGRRDGRRRSTSPAPKRPGAREERLAATKTDIDYERARIAAESDHPPAGLSARIPNAGARRRSSACATKG